MRMPPGCPCPGLCLGPRGRAGLQARLWSLGHWWAPTAHGKALVFPAVALTEGTPTSIRSPEGQTRPVGNQSAGLSVPLREETSPQAPRWKHCHPAWKDPSSQSGPGSVPRRNEVGPVWPASLALVSTSVRQATQQVLAERPARAGHRQPRQPRGSRLARGDSKGPPSGAWVPRCHTGLCPPLPALPDCVTPDALLNLWASRVTLSHGPWAALSSSTSGPACRVGWTRQGDLPEVTVTLPATVPNLLRRERDRPGRCRRPHDAKWPSRLSLESPLGGQWGGPAI